MTFSRRPTGLGTISTSEAIKQAEAGEMSVIDVRDLMELRMSGKAKGALHIPLMMLMTKADPRSPECDPALKTDKPVGIYCATGARSQMAAQMLSQMGYQTVYNLGGLMNWAQVGGKIERI